MQSPRNWKSPTKKLLVFCVFFIISGCSRQSVNVRPSFDEFFLDRHVSGYIRPSFNQENIRKSRAIREQIEAAAATDTSASDRVHVSKVRHRVVQPKPETDVRERPVITGAGRFRRAAEAYLGVPYLWGGVTQYGFDCSGFIWRVFQDLGYASFIRTNAQTMFDVQDSVSRSNIREGDLVFFVNPQNRRRINHVGLYLGDGTFIHSSSTRGVATNPLNDIYWGNLISGFRRPTLVN